MRPEQYLPDHWARSPEVSAFQEANERQLEKLQEARDDMLRQLDPRKADWALPIWERAWGLLVEAEKSLDFRRSRLLARLRGRGTTTVEIIRDVAASYTDMDVEVEEFPEDYAVEIRFIGAIGTPANLEAVGASLSEIMPAHLIHRYQFRHHLGTMEQRDGFFVHMGDIIYVEMEGIT